LSSVPMARSSLASLLMLTIPARAVYGYSKTPA